jgi:hypothetical protein
MTTVVLEGSTERTITQVKVLDGSAERTIAFIRVMGPDMVEREVFTAGGGGSAGGATITPSFRSFSGSQQTFSENFTASATSGAPTAYAWGVVSGSGYVAAGINSATATLSIPNSGGGSFTTFYCDVTIGGQVYRATCSLSIAAASTTGSGGRQTLPGNGTTNV